MSKCIRPLRPFSSHRSLRSHRPPPKSYIYLKKALDVFIDDDINARRFLSLDEAIKKYAPTANFLLTELFGLFPGNGMSRK